MSGDGSSDAGDGQKDFLYWKDLNAHEFWEAEKKRKDEERKIKTGPGVHKKMTESFIKKTYMNSAVKSFFKKAKREPIPVDPLNDPIILPPITRDRVRDNIGILPYINSRRELFLIEYVIGVKKDEIRKLEDQTLMQEKNLNRAERAMEMDAQVFDEFLKENDSLSVEAVKLAEMETKKRLARTIQIKQLNGQISDLRNELSKLDQVLQELYLYRRFLFALSPVDWRIQVIETNENIFQKLHPKAVLDAPIKRPSTSVPTSGRKTLRKPPRKTHKKSLSVPEGSRRSTGYDFEAVDVIAATKLANIRECEKMFDNVKLTLTLTPELCEMWDNEFEDMTPELYFVEPRKVLEVLQELEEQDLSLIALSMDIEESLDNLKHDFKFTEHKLNEETERLRSQIATTGAIIETESVRCADLRTEVKMFSMGQFETEEQQKMLDALDKKIEKVYTSVIGPNEANISSLQMLTSIENKMEDLFEFLETLSPDKVLAAQKIRERDLRIQAREAKKEEMRRAIEIKIQRANERAKLAAERQVGHPLMFRSQPPPPKFKVAVLDTKLTEEEEEYAYFFT